MTTKSPHIALPWRSAQPLAQKATSSSTIGMTKTQTLHTILAACRRNEAAAQKALYQRYFGFGLNLCLRYARDHDEARAMLNDGFFKAFRKINQHNEAASFEAWLRRVLVTSSIDYLRKHKRGRDWNDLEDIENQLVIKTNEHSLEYEDVLKAVQQLPPSYRLIFNLYVIDGYTHVEISKQLDISVGTSKSNLSRAKEKLRKMLGEEYPERLNNK